MEQLKCRVCGHDDIKSLGPIPDSGVFAGQLVAPSIQGGELWLCKHCGSMFRYPTLSSSEYISLYESASGTVWEKEERNDFSKISDYLRNHAGGAILDIGCNTGNFLAGLSGKFRKYGIEPSGMASQSAVSKGIEVLGKTLDDLDSKAVFDVVVAIDVIEHILDVEIFMSQLLAHVKKNGLLIISTGNPDCFFWKRIFRSKFWYSLFAEHLTFPSYKFFKDYSVRNGMRPPERIRFRYLTLTPLNRLSKILHSSALLLPPALYRAFQRFYRGSKNSNTNIIAVNQIGAFTDHHLVIFRNWDVSRD